MDRVVIDPGIMSAGPRILEEDFDGLIDPVLDDDIKAALFDIAMIKPWVPMALARSFKNLLEQDWEEVCIAIKEFFASAHLLKQWNHAIIALVPKSPTASMVHDYRTISCCLVFYKIISNVHVNRLRRVIGEWWMVHNRRLSRTIDYG